MGILGRVPAGIAFLFDLDGVIIHSTPVHNLAWEQYLREHNVATHNIEARMFGKHNDEIVRDFFGSTLTLNAIRQHGEEKERVYRSLIGTEAKRHLVGGVVEFLECYRAIPKAVASNAEPANVAFVLREAGLGDYFLAAVDGSQVERPKPAPDIYLRAAELLGVLPRNCVVFEDSHVGVTAARAAGARVVGLRTTLPELPGADYLAIDFHDAGLPLWLAGLRPS
jgi:HAD superfamily hydrolase (TIGR01509 family)